MIGNLHVEMYLGVPVKYPTVPPVFLLGIDRDSIFLSYAFRCYC